MILITTFIFIIRLIVSAGSSIDHKHAIYISVIEILHESSQAEARITAKVFTDDLESALLNAFEQQTKFVNMKSCKDHSEQIEDYFKKHLKLKINDQMTNLEFSTCEINNDSVWLDFYLKCPSEWKNMEIMSDFFMELFPTQSNIVNIYHGDEKHFFKLTNTDRKQSIVFAR